VKWINTGFSEQAVSARNRSERSEPCLGLAALHEIACYPWWAISTFTGRAIGLAIQGGRHNQLVVRLTDDLAATTAEQIGEIGAIRRAGMVLSSGRRHRETPSPLAANGAGAPSCETRAAGSRIVRAQNLNGGCAKSSQHRSIRRASVG
jgi:hypothetical protein